MNRLIQFIFSIAGNKTKRIIALACLSVVLVVVVTAGITVVICRESDSTRLGLKNIGELATQAAYSAEVSLTDKSISVWGLNLPFTQSKYIYSYRVAIKAGYDFSQIEWSVNRKENVINVKLPEVKILSSEIDPDSFKIYHEAESVFNRISLTDNNDALKMLRENAVNSAIENGLYENARTNAELLISAFLRADYPEDKYSIVFAD